MIAPTEYRDLVARWRELARDTLPADAMAAVVTRGDASLIALEHHRAAHFPADSAGQWAGYHPADGAHAVQLLQAASDSGATHFALPATSFWWLDHYPELRAELDEQATLVASEMDTAMVFELAPTSAGPVTAPHDSAERRQDRDAHRAVVESGRVARTSHGQQHHLLQFVASATRPRRPGSVQVCCPAELLHPAWSDLTAATSTDRISDAEFVVAPAAHQTEWRSVISTTQDLRSIMDRPGIGQVFQRTTRQAERARDLLKRMST